MDSYLHVPAATAAPGPTRRLVRVVAAVVVYGAAALVTLSPEVAELLRSAGLLPPILIAVGVSMVCWIGARVRRNRADRAQLLLHLAERRATVTDVDQLEQLHALPAFEPNRSTYTREG